MSVNKKKIIIIEDDYSQYQIIRGLLFPYFEIQELELQEFNMLTAKLLRYMSHMDRENEYLNAMGNFENVSAFIIDYELKEDSDKTGTLFYNLILDNFQDKTPPVLFLSKIDFPKKEAPKINDIEKLRLSDCNTMQLRKLNFWSQENISIDQRVKRSKDQHFEVILIASLNKLIEHDNNTSNDKGLDDKLIELI